MPFDNTQVLASLKENQMETQQTSYMTLGKSRLLVLWLWSAFVPPYFETQKSKASS